MSKIQFDVNVAQGVTIILANDVGSVPVETFICTDTIFILDIWQVYSNILATAHFFSFRKKDKTKST